MKKLKDKIYYLDSSQLKMELEQQPQLISELDSFHLGDCLGLAIHENKLESLQVLLDLGVSANLTYSLKPLICYALEVGRLESFHLLVSYGATYMTQDVLNTVFSYSHSELIPFFLENKAHEKGLKFSPQWPEESMIMPLLGHNISINEIKKNFSLSYEFELFDAIFAKWEKEKLDKNLDTTLHKTSKIKI